MSFGSEDAPDLPDRWPDVYLAAGARAVSTAGDFVAATALLLAMQERGAGGYAVAGLMLAAAVPMVVVAPLGGRLADRYDSRLLISVVGLAQAVGCAAMLFVTHPVALIALVGLLSAGLAITQPTFGALTPDMVSKGQLPRALAIGQTASSAGMLVAPALAGILYGRYGLSVALLLNAVSYLAIAGVGLALRTRRSGVSKRAAEPGANWRLRDDSLLAYLVPAMFLIITAITAVNVFAVFLVRGTLGASATTYGLLDAVWTGAMLGGAWLLARFDGSDRRLATLLMAAFAVTAWTVFGAAFVPHVGWLAAAYLIGGLCNGTENASCGLLLARRVPSASRGRAIGTYSAWMNAASTIGYVVAAPVLGWLGARGSVAAAGAAGVVAVAALAVPVLRAAGSTEPLAAGSAAEPAAGPNCDHAGSAEHACDRSAQAPWIGASGPPPRGAYPVPELPTDLLGVDAVGRVARRRPVQGHPGPAECRSGGG